MIIASLLATLALSSPLAVSPPPAQYAGESVRASKGYPSLPARSTETQSVGATTVCHPDPNKGRACRHHVAKKEEARARQAERAEVAEADTAALPR